MPDTTPHHTGKGQSGIAMLGIVLVIVIILIALVSAVSLGPQLQNVANERQTVKRANVIVDAMRQYYLARGMLPEPSSVPVGDLNLEQRYRFDAWGQEWEYYKAPTITGMTVDGRQVAGVLISGGPNQVSEYDSSCGSDYCQQGDDIVIPINVQAEAIQIAKNELGVLAGRGCPEATEIDGSNIIMMVFLDRTGLGESYGRDPWSTGSFNYEWHGDPSISGYWVSLGPDGQQIRSSFVDCTTGGPPGTPLAHIDFSDPAFTVGMTPQDIVNVHPAIIAGVGSGASIFTDPGTGETVLYLDGTSSGWVRLHDLVSDPADFCEYTVMGWFKTASGDGSSTFGPIISRQDGWTARTFWATLWDSSVSQSDYQGNSYGGSSPLVQRASSSPTNVYFNFGIGLGETPPALFRNHNWHFFAVNMEAEGVPGVTGYTCTSGGNYTCTLYASDALCSLLYDSQEMVSGPDVGVDPDNYAIYIGRDQSRYFNGYISEISIYANQNTLDNSDIEDWYDSTREKHGCLVSGIPYTGDYHDAHEGGGWYSGNSSNIASKEEFATNVKFTRSGTGLNGARNVGANSISFEVALDVGNQNFTLASNEFVVFKDNIIITGSGRLDVSSNASPISIYLQKTVYSSISISTISGNYNTVIGSEMIRIDLDGTIRFSAN